ncbi:MAG: HIT family protein [Planctomycetes bacterium]|jgi:histidine triad (HIT) family protein|nr:HIT family protein [Planctomycetota bacterium]
MPTLFTRIIDGELPGRFVWRDEHCVAFLSIQPIRPGHTLVVPRREIDHWNDMPAELNAHVFEVARKVSLAMRKGFGCQKVGLSIVGLEVRHAHLHLMQLDQPSDMDFARQRKDVPAAEFDSAAATIRAALRELGFAGAAQRLD